MSKKTAKMSPNGRPLSKREERVVDYMKQNKSISAQEAETNLHNHRLAATIEVLRNKKGYDIDTLRIDTTNAYGEPTWYGRYVFASKRKKREE